MWRSIIDFTIFTLSVGTVKALLQAMEMSLASLECLQLPDEIEASDIILLILSGIMPLTMLLCCRRFKNLGACFKILHPLSVSLLHYTGSPLSLCVNLVSSVFIGITLFSISKALLKKQGLSTDLVLH